MEPTHVLEAETAAAFRLLACLLSAPADRFLLDRLSKVQPSDHTFGRPLDRLASLAGEVTEGEVKEEYQRLFIGLGGGEIVPYGSHYLAGSLHDRPLVVLRGEMRQLGVARAPSLKEPEDHAATVLEICAGLLDGSLPCDEERTCQFVNDHGLSWMPRFFADLERCECAPFHAAAGAFGLASMARLGS